VETAEELPETFRITRQYLIMEAAVMCNQDPFEAIARWTPAQAETAVQFARVRKAIEERRAERMAMLGTARRMSRP
jgi:hypothetical protein